MKNPRDNEAVSKFVAAMRKRLNDNDHKGGWDLENDQWLLGMARSELRQVGLKRNLKSQERKALVDCANYLMMAWDNSADD